MGLIISQLSNILEILKIFIQESGYWMTRKGRWPNNSINHIVSLPKKNTNLKTRDVKTKSAKNQPGYSDIEELTGN